MDGRWGSEGRLDFWTALARGDVDTPELRAMSLLESVCDEYRFSLYAHTAEMPALGNVTGTMFSVRKDGGVAELSDDGRVVSHWCISIGPHFGVPGTDNVVILKAMIEGEEAQFRATGNKNVYMGSNRSRPIGVVTPHTQKWLPDRWQKEAVSLREGATYLPDPLELPATIRADELAAWTERERVIELQTRRRDDALREGESWVQPDRTERHRDNRDQNWVWNMQEDLGDGIRAGESGGVILGDGRIFQWNDADAETARVQFGISVHDQVVLMNGEGHSREMIEWCLQNMYGVTSYGSYIDGPGGFGTIGVPANAGFGVAQAYDAPGPYRMANPLGMGANPAYGMMA